MTDEQLKAWNELLRATFEQGILFEEGGRPIQLRHNAQAVCQLYPGLEWYAHDDYVALRRSI
jgi:hypothetical protein